MTTRPSGVGIDDALDVVPFYRFTLRESRSRKSLRLSMPSRSRSCWSASISTFFEVLYPGRKIDLSSTDDFNYWFGDFFEVGELAQLGAKNKMGMLVWVD